MSWTPGSENWRPEHPIPDEAPGPETTGKKEPQYGFPPGNYPVNRFFFFFLILSGALAGFHTEGALATGLIPALEMPNVPVIKNNAPPSASPPKVTDITLELALTEGQKDLSERKDQEALQVFKGILLDTPRDKVPLPVYLGISRSYRHLKAPDRSIATLLPLLKSEILAQADADSKREFVYELGVSDALMHNEAGIEHFLIPVFPHLEKPREILTATRSLIPYFEKKNPLEGSILLGHALDRVDPVHQQDMLSSIISLIHDHIPDSAQLQSIRASFPHEFPGDYALFRIGLQAIAKKEPEKGETLFLELLSDYPASLFTGAVEERLNHLDLPQNLPVLAVILPRLSDPVRGTYARSILSGLRAFIRHQETEGNPPISTVLRFSKSSVNYLQTLKILSERQDVVALLGPFFADDLRASARFLQQQGIPSVSPTLPPRKSLTVFFSTATLPEMMAAAAAFETEKKIRSPKVVVIYPSGPYGELSRAAFSRTLSSLGGQVTGSIPYNPKKADNQSAINRLKKYGRTIEFTKDAKLPPNTSMVSTDTLQMNGKIFFLNKHNKGGQVVRSLFFPSFDALYVPDTSSEPASLLREIAYKNIQNVLLIGNETFLGIRGLSGLSDLHDTILATGPPPSSPSISRLIHDSGSHPSLFSLQTYDALSLIKKSFQAGSVYSRHDILAFLEAHPSLEGLSGTLTWNGPGKFKKTITVYQLSGRRWIPSDTVEVPYEANR